MTQEEQDDLKDELRVAAWSFVRNSALYKEGLLSNDQCDQKADQLVERWFADGIVWIVDQELAELAKRDAERDAVAA